MPLLTATNLVKSYGGRKVVDEVSLEVGEGEVVGLVDSGRLFIDLIES